MSRERAQSFARDNSNAFRTAAQTFRNDLRSELDRQKNITAEVLKLREEEGSSGVNLQQHANDGGSFDDLGKTHGYETNSNTNYIEDMLKK